MDTKVAKRRGRVTSWKGNAWIRFKRGVQPTTRRRGSTGVDILASRSLDVRTYMCIYICMHVCMCVSAYGTSPDRYYRGARPCAPPRAHASIVHVHFSVPCEITLNRYSLMLLKLRKSIISILQIGKTIHLTFLHRAMSLEKKKIDFAPRIFSDNFPPYLPRKNKKLY